MEIIKNYYWTSEESLQCEITLDDSCKSLDFKYLSPMLDEKKKKDSGLGIV